MRGLTRLFFIAGFLFVISGCGSQSSLTSTTPAGVPVSLTITDTPPAGVTVLFFQLSIMGASLTSSSGAVSLLNSTNPIPVNVTQLQTDSAFLGSANVPAGTYTGLSFTVSNPQLTIFNGSSAAIGSCLSNTVCQLTPTTTPSTLTFSTAPFPVTLAANSPLAFKLDIHLNAIIQQNLNVDLAATDGVTISQLPSPVAGAPVSALGHLVGTIQSLTPNGFTLQTGDGRSFNIGVSASTIYNYPSAVCTSDNFACLATGQIVKVGVSLLTPGTLQAVDVTYVQPAGQIVVEGNIIRLSSSGGNTLMDLILQKGPPMPAASTSAIAFGQRVTVTVPPTGVTYAVDSGSFTIPSGLSFAGSADLAVGQQVSAVIQGSITTASNASSSVPITGPAAITFTTKGIMLEPSQITGSVAAINASGLSFTLSTLPIYFVPPAPTNTLPPIPAPVNITVQTTSATTFVNLNPNSIAGLAINDVVSVGGWIFSTPSGATAITQAAQSVLGRPGPTPLF